MQALQLTSLGDQISKKISAWILILVLAVIVAVFSVSFILSQQMFDKQTSTWGTIIPQQLRNSLMDSDHFSVKREVQFLKSTGLFSAFVITDNKKKVIDEFGNHLPGETFIPIKDSVDSIWGYYSLKPDYYHFILPFGIAVIISLLFILLFYFLIRRGVRSSLESEFMRFNHFLKEIENFTSRLPEIYQQEDEFKFTFESSYSSEQALIHKSISHLLEEIIKSNKSLREAITYAEKKRFEEELTETALQVAHDIGSPLSLLELVNTDSLPEDKRITIKHAAMRIRDISNTLLQKAKINFLQRDGRLMPQMLQNLIELVVSEKRIQYGNCVDIVIEMDGYAGSIFSYIKSSDFNRVLSNLINNSIEAIVNDRRIRIKLYNDGTTAIVQVQDYGKGIAPEMMAQLGHLGNSFGKSTGTGLGLNHAFHTVENWGGKITISSQVSQGTTVEIRLPACQPPNWFTSEITIAPDQLIVVVDDDQAIHTLWGERFNNVEIKHFYSPDELVEWHRSVSTQRDILYLCDYEFVDHAMNGIELIMSLQINYFSILVTNSVIDRIASQCEVDNIRILPKNVAASIPIVRHG